MFESVSRLIIAVCVPSILLRMKRQQFMRGVVLHFQAFELDGSGSGALQVCLYRCVAGALRVPCGCLACLTKSSWSSVAAPTPQTDNVSYRGGLFSYWPHRALNSVPRLFVSVCLLPEQTTAHTEGCLFQTGGLRFSSGSGRKCPSQGVAAAFDHGWHWQAATARPRNLT